MTEEEDNRRFNELQKQQSKTRAMTLWVAIAAGGAGVLGGAAPEVAKQVTEDHSKYQLVIVDKSLDASTPVGVFRFDPKTGQVTYVTRRKDGTTEWVLVSGSHESMSSPTISNTQPSTPNK
jgi:hypothetical protein